MDVGLISFVIAQLVVVWRVPAAELSWVASAGFVGMAVGATLGGLLADRVGRRQVFALTLLVYGLATGASALAGSVAVLLVLRFVVGLGLGAELPVASTLVSEFAPPRIRGRAVVVLESFWAVGWILAALVGYLVVPLRRRRVAVGARARRGCRRCTPWSCAAGCRSPCGSSSSAAGTTRPSRWWRAFEGSRAVGHDGRTGAQVRDAAAGDARVDAAPPVDADPPTPLPTRRRPPGPGSRRCGHRGRGAAPPRSGSSGSP